MHSSITSSIDFVIFLFINVKLFNNNMYSANTNKINLRFDNASLLPTNDFSLKSEQSLDLKQ